MSNYPESHHPRRVRSVSYIGRDGNRYKITLGDAVKIGKKEIEDKFDFTPDHLFGTLGIVRVISFNEPLDTYTVQITDDPGDWVEIDNVIPLSDINKLPPENRQNVIDLLHV